MSFASQAREEIARRSLQKDCCVRAAAYGIACFAKYFDASGLVLQTEQELMSYPLHLLPQHFTLENYQAVFAKVPLLLYLKNSVIVCVIAIFAQVIFATLAAYAFACFEFPRIIK